MSSNNRPRMASYRSPHVREPSHIHQSMLRLYEENPVEFYLQEMAPEGTVSDFQSIPAAIGCSFDAHVKSLAARLTGIPCKSLKVLLQDNVELPKEPTVQGGYSPYEVAINKGRWLLAGYVESGAFKAWLDERPHSLEIHIKNEKDGVPIEGTLDAAMFAPSGPLPLVHDWKTTGTNRPGEVSPHPGYARLFDTDGPGAAVGPHDRYKDPLETIDERWAMQVTVYGFLLGREPAKTMASIDEIIAGRDGRVRVAQYRTHVSKKFQEGVLKRLKALWKAVKSKKVLPPEFVNVDIDFLLAMR